MSDYSITIDTSNYTSIKLIGSQSPILTSKF